MLHHRYPLSHALNPNPYFCPPLTRLDIIFNPNQANEKKKGTQHPFEFPENKIIDELTYEKNVERSNKLKRWNFWILSKKMIFWGRRKLKQGNKKRKRRLQVWRATQHLGSKRMLGHSRRFWSNDFYSFSVVY